MEQDERKQATAFTPETKLPDSDWQQKLDHDPELMFKHMWEHHAPDEYIRFIKEFGGVMKFGDALSDE